MDVRDHNREAWNRQVEKGNPWTRPVGESEVEAARGGTWQIFLTPIRAVPVAWFPPLVGCRVLCLASGGGQQGPLLAAAGASVTVFDNSPAQLAQDRFVAERDGLDLRLVEGDMRDLSEFPDASFDLIVHPVSNTFVPDVRPVWREAFRVLRAGGRLMAGFDQPFRHIFDDDAYERGVLKPIHTLPHSPEAAFTDEEKARMARDGVALEFGHTLEDQIGGQLDAGFVIEGFYEDRDRDGVGDGGDGVGDGGDLLSRFTSTYIATLARKP